MLDVVYCACFVVDMHKARQYRFVVHLGQKVGNVDVSVVGYVGKAHFVAFTAELHHGVVYGGVFRSGNDDVAAFGFCRAENCNVVRFRTARCKVNFARVGSDKLGYLLSRFV